jgi:hypothetical protein
VSSGGQVSATGELTSTGDLLGAEHGFHSWRTLLPEEKDEEEEEEGEEEEEKEEGGETETARGESGQGRISVLEMSTLLAGEDMTVLESGHVR